jgi:hypothetical protein
MAAFQPPASDFPIEFFQRKLDEAGGKDYLSAFGWPEALQENFLKSVKEYPIRFMIIDNSGSMATGDGKRIMKSAQGKKLVSSSRWGEIGDFVEFHAGFASSAKAYTEFRLLNGSTSIAIGKSHEEDMRNMRTLKERMSDPPAGSTPLCRHVCEIVKKIQGTVYFHDLR